MKKNYLLTLRKIVILNGVKKLNTSISNCFEIFRGVYIERSKYAQYDNYNTLRKVSYLLFTLFILSLFLLSACKHNPEKKSSNVAADSTNSNSTSIIEENIWTRYNFDQRDGKRLFEHYCSVCHGVGGAGDGFNSYNLNPKPNSFRDSVYMSNLSDPNLQQIITLGGQSMNKSTLMPAYSHTLSEIQIERLIKFIRTLVKG
ncbi:MAG: cytochrome c [Melioribacteraceae bacterium]